VLFTISLVALVPHNLQLASTWQQRFVQQAERLWVQNFLMSIGFASLAFVLVGLIVIWMGYIHRVRWACFVMFVIVWVYAFPLYMLPVLLNLHAAESINWSAAFWDAIKSPGIARDYVKGPLDFLVMVVALFLPIKSFFRRPSATAPGAGRDD
jgi:small-conductance mechanosensitive channel